MSDKLISEMSEVIYTVGLPGSGKSTWAKQYVKELEQQGKKAVCIELDEMRIEFGVSPDNKEIDKFTLLLKERQKRINKYLSLNYVVILSDTNLCDKAVKQINELSKRKNVKSITKMDFTHIPLEECIKRDLKRKQKGERYVGEKVIRKMYQRIRPNNIPISCEKVLIVDDVHRDNIRLRKLLKEVSIYKQGNK